jgi:hypothetical protein
MFAVHRNLPKERPDVAREIFRVLAESKARAGLPKAGEIDQLPFGFEACRKSLELITRYAYEQKIVKKVLKLQAAKAASKFKNEARWGTPFATPILLQDHGDEVWYRDVWIRLLP